MRPRQALRSAIRAIYSLMRGGVADPPTPTSTFTLTLTRTWRQRTIRELQLGKTLLQAEGKWTVKHTAGNYKTGKVIPPSLEEKSSGMVQWRFRRG